jgi:hypothetical protein
MGIVLVAMWTDRRPAADPQAGQIELLTMRDELAGDTLVVVGVVHVAGLEGEDVAAVISTYGPQGQLMGRGESQLQPADATERMFLIAVAGSAAAVRYHVSFRTPGGSLVRHLDRRGAARPVPVPAGATFIHERSRGRRETRG